jgi:hypothetical protein
LVASLLARLVPPLLARLGWRRGDKCRCQWLRNSFAFTPAAATATTALGQAFSGVIGRRRLRFGRGWYRDRVIGRL